MERVALLLQTTAIGAKGSKADFDLFGRSAYNRYYYAMFLLVRDMLAIMNQDWTSVPHKAIPELLNGTVVQRLKRAGKQATKIGDGDANKLCSQAVSAAIGLADLMKEGYASRITADYNPSIPVVLSGSDRFTLNSVSINVAHDWPNRTRQLTPKILRAWRLTSE